MGKIQIIKTFAIPKLMFRASVIPIPNDLVKEVNSIFYDFIWNGKESSAVCSSQILMKGNLSNGRFLVNGDFDRSPSPRKRPSLKFSKGGLKMLDTESMMSARRVVCLKKFLEDYPSTWKSFLNSCILSVGGSLILHCNFDTTK